MNYEYRGAEGRSTFKKTAEEVCGQPSPEDIKRADSDFQPLRTNLTKEGYLGPLRVSSLEILLLPFSLHSAVTHWFGYREGIKSLVPL